MSNIGGYIADVLGISFGKSPKKGTPGFIVKLTARERAILDPADIAEGRIDVKGADFEPLETPISAEAAVWISEKVVVGKQFQRILEAIGYTGTVENFLRKDGKTFKVPAGQRAVVVCEEQTSGGKSYDNWRVLWPRKGAGGMTPVSAADLDLSNLADIATGLDPNDKGDAIPY